MAKHTRNKLIFNPIAVRIVDQATGEGQPAPLARESKAKDQATIARDRKGGVKGGKASAEKMTMAQRSASAKNGARWNRAANG